MSNTLDVPRPENSRVFRYKHAGREYVCCAVPEFHFLVRPKSYHGRYIVSIINALRSCLGSDEHGIRVYHKVYAYTITYIKIWRTADGGEEEVRNHD